MRSFSQVPTLLRSVAAGSVLVGTLSLIGAEREPRDAPPKLLSPNGSAPKWKNLEELERYASKGDPLACHELAVRLSGGDGLAKDTGRAKQLFEQAARGGVVPAWFYLGKIYHDGVGVAQNYPEALRCYLAAARGGVAEAQHNLGAMLVSARGVKRDYVEGLAWIIVATKSGANPAGERAVRERMAGRTKDIAAAETRAAEILKNIASATARGTFLDVSKTVEETPLPVSRRLPPDPLVPARPTTKLPKMDVSPPPKTGVPVPAVPPALPKDAKP